MKNISLFTKIRITFFDPDNPPNDNGSLEIAYSNIPNKNDFVELPITITSGKFIEEMAQTRAGQIFTKSVSCKVPKHYKNFDAQIQQFKSKPITAMLTDANGVVQLVFPLLLSSLIRQNDGTITSYRGNLINLTGKSDKSSIFVNAVPSDAVFINIEPENTVLPD